MSIDLNALRAKLNELSNKSKVSDILWKPQEGANQIRIVPLANNPENPFIEAFFHYLGGKTYLSPLTFNEPDPIEEFAQKLRGDGGLTKEEWNETKKFVPKMRTYAAVVVRGKESDGIRYWGFGKTTYQELLSVIADPEYGDITDSMNGRDVKVTFTPKEKSDTGFPKTTIRVSPKQTPITTNKELLDKLLTVQPDLLDAYPKMSYDELKSVLERFLTPTTKQEVAKSNVKEEEDWDTPQVESPTAASSKKTEQKKSSVAVDEFDELFNKE